MAGGGGALSLVNSTVVRNSATDAAAASPRGGGLYQADPAVVTIQDSIVALNTDASSVPGPDCKGTVTAVGHSLLGSNQNCTYAPGPGDILNLDPVLGPLADNGGPTKSVAPLPGSPAIDAGASALGTDQRGSPRPVDVAGVPNAANGSDIGSVEVAASPAVDTTPPETTIDSGPFAITNNNDPSLGFSSEPGSTFECRLDGPGAAIGTFASCTSPKSYTDLPDGSYTFAVRAIDSASNLDPTPATRGFTVDTTPPDTAITKKPKGKIKTKKKTAKVKVSFTSEAGADIACKLDKANYKSCSSPFSVKAKSKGGKGKKHTISITATDHAGNVGEPTVVKFTVIRKG